MRGARVAWFVLLAGPWAGCGGDSARGSADGFGRPDPEGGVHEVDAPQGDASAEPNLDLGSTEVAVDSGPERAPEPAPDVGAEATAMIEPMPDIGGESPLNTEPLPEPAPEPVPDASAADMPVPPPDMAGAIDVSVDVPADIPADVPVDAPAPAANIGAWCDPAESDGALNNPACVGGTRCLVVRDPGEGMCVIFGCSVDLPTAAIDEESCHVAYGTAYVCVDLDGAFGDALEPYDPPAFADGQNANLQDNVCLRRCTPSDSGNDCEPEFACSPDSTRFNFDDAVCYFPACGSGVDCPVTVSPSGSCMLDTDCDTGAGQFCTSVQDLDGDGTLEMRACALPGDCNAGNGLCDPHTLGSPGSAIGAPCAFDAGCPDGGACVLEGPAYDALGNIVARVPHNGYCTRLGCRFAATLVTAACPPGAECNHNYYAGGCQPACDVGDPWGCRNNDCDPLSGLTVGCDWFSDLDCYDWSGWSFGNGLPLVGGPTGIVCDYDGSALKTCEDIWNMSGGVGCPGVAPVGNPWGMDCYDRETATPMASDTDPLGRCLDVTTSGPACADFGQYCDGFCVDTGGGPCP